MGLEQDSLKKQNAPAFGQGVFFPGLPEIDLLVVDAVSSAFSSRSSSWSGFSSRSSSFFLGSLLDLLLGMLLHFAVCSRSGSRSNFSGRSSSSSSRSSSFVGECRSGQSDHGSSEDNVLHFQTPWNEYSPRHRIHPNTGDADGSGKPLKKHYFY